jgi:hypothetical protein
MRLLAALLGVLIVSAAWWAVALGGDDQGVRTVRMHGRVIGPDGRGRGGTLVIYELDEGRILGAFRVDMSGRVDVSADVRNPLRDLGVVFCSIGGLRNTRDELHWSPVARGKEEVHVKEENEIEQNMNWPMGTAKRLADFARSRATEVREIVPSATGLSAFEIVGMVIKPPALSTGDDDLGDVAFRVRRDVAEVLVSLVAPDGSPLADGIVLGGFPYSSQTMRGNSYYPHFAVTQDGPTARIALSRAAARLLRSNSRGLLVFVSRVDPRICGRVELMPGEEAKLLSGGNALRARCVIELHEAELEADFTAPRDWDYAEESLFQ